MSFDGMFSTPGSMGEKEEVQPDGSSVIIHLDGSTSIINAPKTELRDPNWTPDTANATPIDWDNNRGLDLSRQAPVVPGGADTPGEGVHVISVDAVVYFGRSLDPLIAEVRKALEELSGLGEFGPGTFGAAHNFRAKVFGSNGDTTGSLKASTILVLQDTLSILDSIQKRCDEIAQKYRTADQLTELDAEEFTSMVSKVQSSVSGMNLGAA
jgi:hypothetical protein